MVDNDRVQLIRELSRLTIPVTIGNDPLQIHLAIGGRLKDLDINTPPLGQIMNWEPREDGFGSDDIESGWLLTWGGNWQFHIPYFIVGGLHSFLKKFQQLRILGELLLSVSLYRVKELRNHKLFIYQALSGIS
jgi:hypothetical protein